MSGPVDIWAILVILLVFTKKVVPLLKSLIQLIQSHLDCVNRIEKKLDDRHSQLIGLATKEDVYHVSEKLLIDKLNVKMNGKSGLGVKSCDE